MTQTLLFLFQVDQLNIWSILGVALIILGVVVLQLLGSKTAA